MEPDDKAAKKESGSIPIDYRRVPDDQFYANYANHVLLEPTAWDLKLIFGKIDLAKGPTTVVQHSAMTLPWSQIKVGIYLLQYHLALHEIMCGKVQVPKGVISPPMPPTEDQEREDPRAVKTYEALEELFRRFCEANPEAF
jgi:hypothetical protein